MRTLSEIKGEEALDITAELIPVVAEIAADKEMGEALKEGKRAQAVALAIKNHKPGVIKTLALLDGTPVEEYEFSLATLPADLLKLLSDPTLQVLFQ